MKERESMMRSVLAFLLMVAAAPAVLAAGDYDPYADREIGEDVADLPPAVQETRSRLIEATRSGDLESLRLIIEEQGGAPVVSFGLPDDPVGYLREQSLDPEGRQILALLRNLLEMPYAVIGVSGETPNYVWPYLAVVELDALTPEEMVDALRLVTPEELQMMRDFGGWIDWRVFIGADGEWQAFVAGD